jgi:hypothetical protein
MATPQPPGSPADLELDELVFACLERMESDGDAALEELCRQHPALAERLRSRVAALSAAGLVGGRTRQFPERLGEFRLLRRLGEGGMGVVYLAEQTSLGRQVALKVLRPEQLYFAGARERFAREVALVARMQHPGIVPVYAVGEEQGIPFLAMELVRGCTLDQVIGNLRGRDPATLTGGDLSAQLGRHASSSDMSAAALEGSWVRCAVALVLQVARALEHAHAQDVLHRDVKPSNIIVGPDGRARLLDFGLAVGQGMSRLTRTGAQVGSLPYLPPEIAVGGGLQVDQRSDVYSLGVTLYELLTLRLPFQGRSSAETLRAIDAARTARPRRWNAEVSWDVETCCLTAMERDPARRYASAAEFARDLEHLLALRPIEARRASPWLRARRWVQRHPAWAVACAAGALLALGGPIAYARFEHRSRVRLQIANGETQAANVELGKALAQVQAERDRAQQENLRAEKNLNDALRAVDVMLTQLGDERLAGVPQANAVRRVMLDKAVEFYRNLAEQRRDDPAMSETVRQAISRVGQLHFQFDEFDEAVAKIRESLAMAERALIAYPGRCPILREIIAFEVLNLANVASSTGRHAAAEYYYLEAIGDYGGLIDVAKTPARAISALATARYNFGTLLKNQRRFEEALRAFELARAGFLEALAAQPAHPARNEMLALTQGELALVAGALGRTEQAWAHAERALEAWDMALAFRPQDQELPASRAKTATDAANLLRQLGRPAEALALAEGAVATLERSCADFAERRLFRALLIDAHAQRSSALLALGKQEAALQAALTGRDLARALSEAEPESPRGWLNWTRAGRAVAVAGAASGDGTLEREAWREAWEAARRLVALEPGVLQPREEWADLAREYAACLKRQGLADEALEVERASLP